jgi:diamine N-acetyltransferase
MSRIALEPVTERNFRAVIALKVGDDQRGFVAENVVSLAQTVIYPWTVARAVEAEGTPVGFVLWGLDPADGAWSIVRLMIAREQQRRGYGTAALGLVLDEIHRARNGEDVVISLVPANATARRLYERLGFRATGRVVDGEDVLALRGPWPPNPA